MRLIFRVVLLVTCVGVIYFGYLGGVGKPWEGDSLAYHLPIAKIIADGRIGDRAALSNNLYFYPGIGEALVAVMMRLGVPLNLYNLLGWIALGGVVLKLGKIAGLKSEEAVVLAGAVVWWPAVVRLVLTETGDIWLAVFWVLGVIWVEKGGQGWKYWGVLGIWLGAILGIKYSGVFYLPILGAFYWRRFWECRKDWGWLVVTVPILVIGGSWYGRNLLLTGSPMWPAGWGPWKGATGFKMLEWNPAKTAINFPGKFGEAMISEYLIWPILGFWAVWRGSKWGWLGLFNWGVYMILPSWPENVVSDLRYGYVAMIPIVIAIWKWARAAGRIGDVAVLAMAAVAVEWAQLDFRPKIFVGVMLFGWIFWGRKKWHF